VRLAVSTVVFLLVTASGTWSGRAQPRDLGTPGIILVAPWGNGPGELGKKDGGEGASLGPMSFAFGPDGSLHLLDQVNGRIAVFRAGGGAVTSDRGTSSESPADAGATPFVFDRFIAIPGTTFEEVEVGVDGRILLLDRLVREALVVLDPRTRESEAFPIVGLGIPEGGGVTALLVRSDGIWLEFSREHSVRVLDSRWLPCERTIVVGRPARGFPGTVEASLGIEGGADVKIDAAETGVRSLFVRDDEPIGRLIEVADGPSGAVLLVYYCIRWADDGDALAFQEVRGRWYGPNGRGLATFTSPHTLSEWEQFREFRILSDGSAVQMTFFEDGVKLLKWRGP